MSGPVIISGGPGSGKTEEVVARLAARYSSSPFYEATALVPTSRHGDQLRRRLVSRCGVALRLRVETISQFSQTLSSSAGRLSPTVAEELLARIVRREIESGPASYFRPIAHTEGLVSLLNAAVRDLLAESIEPPVFLEAADGSGSSALMGLSAIFAAYRSELDRHDWLHPAQVPLAAAEAVKAGAALPRLVVLDGFQVFRGVELTLLQAVSERAEVLATFDPESGARAQHDYERLLESLPNTHVIELKGRTAVPTTVTAGTASDREDQLRAMARQIKQRLTRTRRFVPRTAPWRSDRCPRTWVSPGRCSPSTTCLSIPQRESVSTPVPWESGCADLCTLPGTAGACATWPRYSQAGSSTSAAGGYPPMT